MAIAFILSDNTNDIVVYIYSVFYFCNLNDSYQDMITYLIYI